MSLIEAFDLNKSRAEKKACCDYGFHVSVCKYDENTAKQMETLVNEKKINSFKAYMAPIKENQMISDEDLISVLEKCKQLGALGLVHAENGQLIKRKQKEIKELGITGPEGFKSEIYINLFTNMCRFYFSL
jgi:dihydroorotase-like cyclic amidohydrolase